MAGYKGIDLSHWNDIVDYKAVAEQVDFIILKAGGSDCGFYEDSKFHKRHLLFEALGVDLGCYYFVGQHFYGYDNGKEDAKRFIHIIDKKKFTYPVVLDIESTLPKRKEEATEACIGFCDELESAGYYAMIYASDVSGFKDRLILDKLKRFDKWVARYGSEPKIVPVDDYGIWQKSSSGHLAGIIGRVDLDVSYRSYPSIIKRAGLNNL